MESLAATSLVRTALNATGPNLDAGRLAVELPDGLQGQPDLGGLDIWHWSRRALEAQDELLDQHFVGLPPRSARRRAADEPLAGDPVVFGPGLAGSSTGRGSGRRHSR